MVRTYFLAAMAAVLGACASTGGDPGAPEARLALAEKEAGQLRSTVHDLSVRVKELEVALADSERRREDAEREREAMLEALAAAQAETHELKQHQTAEQAAAAEAAAKREEEMRRALATFQGAWLFEANEAVMRFGARRALAPLSRYLRENPQGGIVIEGYADEATGSPEDALVLSQRRAEALRQVLVEQGVDPERLVVRGTGEANPDTKVTLFPSAAAAAGR